jgi:hypothetical protein
MDRPILAGEFPAKSWSTDMIGPSSGQPLKTSKTITEAFEYAYTNGYAGAMSWSMSEQASSFFGDYSTTAPALTALFNAHQSDIMIKDVVIEEMSGNYVMALHLENLAPPSGDEGYWELGTSLSQDWTGKTNLSFDIYVEPGSADNLQIVPVIKVTDSWTWSPANDNATQLTNVEQGAWTTVSVPITAFGAASVNDVREFLFQYWALSTPYASGTIYFDNVRVDDDTFGDFDMEGSAWFTGADNASVALVKYFSESAVEPGYSKMVRTSWHPGLAISGKIITVDVSRATAAQITLFDLKGSAAMTIDCRSLGLGKHSFPLHHIPSGPYIVEMRNKNQLERMPVLVK